MKRAWTLFRILLGVQAALASAAAVAELASGCAACRLPAVPLGLCGALLYGGLLAAALLRGPSLPLFAAALVATGVHLFLAARMLAAGPLCPPCLGAAAVSIALGGCAVAAAPDRLGRVALLLPLSVVPGVLTAPAPAPADVATTAAVRVTVFAQADCPYCDVLKHVVIPAVVPEFGPRVAVAWRDAAEMPSLRRTPTVIVARGPGHEPARVFEGLPTADMLRAAILQAEGGP